MSEDQELVQAAPLVQNTQGRLHPARNGMSLVVREPVHIHSAQLVCKPHVARLRQESRVVNEAPGSEQRVHASGVAVVAQNP